MINKNIHIIFLLFLSPILIQVQAQFDKEVFEELSTEAGLSSTVVTSILKDSQGFMWFGTQNGLNKFDGYTFTTYTYSDTSTNSISGNYILTIFEDKDENIWIGTQKNGLNKYNRAKNNFENFKNDTTNPTSISSNNVRIATQMPDGTLYFGTEKCVNIYDPINKSFQTLPLLNKNQNLSSLAINALFSDDDGSIWIGTNNGLFWYFPETKNLQEFHHDSQKTNTLSSDYINDIIKLSTGELCIATNMGLNIYNSQTEDFNQFYYNQNNVYNEAKSELQALVEDNRGNLWLGSFGGGLVKLDISSKRIAFFVNGPENNTSLSNDYIYSLYFDDAGILWIGTYGGGINKIDLVKIRFENIQHNPERNSLGSNDVYSILPMNNEIWFGTDNGISILDKSSDLFSTLNLASESANFDGKSVYSMLEDSQRNIWIGTAGDGLSKINKEDRENEIVSLKTFTSQSPAFEKINDDEVLCLFEDHNEHIWVGTTNGISVVKNDRIVASFYHEHSDSLSLADNEIYCITQDKQKDIWIGTFAGLNKFNSSDSTFHTLSHDPKIKNSLSYTIYSLYCDNDGYLWAGTDNGGLLKINPQNNQLVLQFTKDDQLPDNVIYGILEDKESNLWLSSNKGITKAIKQGNSDNLTFINYNTSNWLWINSYNIGAFAKGSDEMLYFGSFEGVTYFDPDQVKGNNYLPPVYITDFQLFFKPVEISADKSTPLSRNISETKTIKLKHDQNVIKFGFTALNYIQAEKNMFAFRMKGLEENWNYTTGSREAQYLYLPPGEYRFQVKASNNNGVWNEEGASVDIIIKPRFTQTLWFYIIVISVLSIIIFWVMSIRTRRLRVARNKLEKKVQTRTRELRKTNQDLNTALDDLKKTQAQLIDSEKMASLGQLTAGVAHEINNPINFVSGNVVPLKRDIADILEVLEQYNVIVNKLDMADQFDEVDILKKNIDFDFVLKEIDNLLDGIGEGASRTAEIVKGLRNFSRLDEHELKYSNINEGIDSTILILHNKLKERIRITKDYGSFKDIMCYPGQMNQVFMNVLNNAQEAIEGDGEIRIKTWLEDHKLNISVKDNGRGMTENIIKKIFDPFYTTKDVGKGTGLGLSISFGIIEKHNGDIKINSTPGKGTEFIISIPDNLI